MTESGTTELVTVDDLSPGQSLPVPIVVEVRDVDWRPEKSRRAHVELVDTEQNPLQLVDYDGANISVEWKENHQYKIAQCSVRKGGHGYEVKLTPSKRTQIDPLGPAEETTQLLVVGDTHIGRTSNPKNGRKIDPITAFKKAAEYGIAQKVDAVVHVGDIFHDTGTEDDATRVLKQIFVPLAEADIPFYYVRGNHTSEPGDEVLNTLEGALVANLNTTGAVVGSNVRLVGINHHQNGAIPRRALRFPDAITEPVSILVLHQTIKQLSGGGSKSVDLNRIQAQFGGRFDFVLSGHHHDAKRTEWNGTTVMYTGAAERMSTNTDPTDRVAWLLKIRDGSVACERYDIP